MTHDKSMELPNDSVEEKTDPDVVELQQGIELTRADMSSTIEALESRLTSDNLRDKVGAELSRVEERVRVVVHEQLIDAKEMVKAELVEAKNLLRSEMNEAELKVRKGLSDARASIKEDVSSTLTGAKHRVRAATLGKVEDLATNIGDKMNEARDTLVDTVRKNPVPAAIMGIGLAWLLMNRSRSASSSRDSNGNSGNNSRNNQREKASQAIGGTGTNMADAAHSVTDAASRGLQHAVDAAGNAAHSASDATVALAHRAGDAASHLAEQAGDAAQSLAGGAKRQAQRVEHGFQTTLHDSPMVVGAAALALGVVVGFSLPRSDPEDSLMGATRDRVLRQAGDVAHDAASSLANLAQQAVDGAKHAVAEPSAT